MKTPHKTPAGPQTLELDVALIDFDPKNRKEHAKAALDSLRDSIAAEGLLEPLVVRFNPDKPGRYRLIAGERRLRACQALRLAKVPARLIADETEAGAARKRLVENMQREDLTPIEEARGFRELAVDHKMTQAQIAALAGVAQPTVANALRLLELPAAVQQMIQNGKLTRAHGVTLARFVKWPKIVTRMAELAVNGGETSKELEEEDVPYSHSLARGGLIAHCTAYDYNTGHYYTVPDSLLKDPAFIGDSRSCYCMEPEKWAPEKKRQDAERKKKSAAADKAEAAKQSKLSPAEAAKRKKKIADNRQARVESALALQATYEHLRTLKTLDDGIVTAMVAKVLADSRYGSKVKEAAAKIGLTIPAGLLTSSWYTQVHYKKLATLSVVDQLRLVAGAVATFHGEKAIKFAHEIPDELEIVIGAKKAAACRKQASDSIAAAKNPKGAKK